MIKTISLENAPALRSLLSLHEIIYYTTYGNKSVTFYITDIKDSEKLFDIAFAFGVAVGNLKSSYTKNIKHGPGTD